MISPIEQLKTVQERALSYAKDLRENLSELRFKISENADKNTAAEASITPPGSNELILLVSASEMALSNLERNNNSILQVIENINQLSILNSAAHIDARAKDGEDA